MRSPAIVSSFLVAAAALSVSPALAGDVDDASQHARLDLSPAPLGGSVKFVLRAPAPGLPAVLFVDASVGSVDPDGVGALPFLRVLGPSTLLAVLPSVGAGVVDFDVPVPSTPSLFGATFFAQAITVTAKAQYEACNVAATTLGPAPATPAFQEATSGVPAIAHQVATHGGAARDLDFDGDPDLVLATSTGVLVFRNDGALSFTDVSASVLPAEASVDANFVALFDADLDHDIDVFVGGGLSSAVDPPLPNFLLRNQATQGSFTFVHTPLPAIAGLTQEAVVADFDRDGDLDLVLANGQDGVHSGESPDPNSMLVNLAAEGNPGQFAVNAAFAAAAWNLSGAFNNGAAAGDIDGDGDLDLHIARADTMGADGIPGQPNVLLRNDGGLNFTDVSATNLQPQFSDNSRKARFADFDSDGDVDLVVANSVIGVNTSLSGELYLNDGSGVFTEASAQFPQITESELSIGLNVHPFDADLDGDLDVLFSLHEFFDTNGSLGVPGGTGGDGLLMVNQGGAQFGFQGAFVIQPGFTTGGAFVSPDPVIADFDLDGDDDFYVCAEGGLLAPKLQDHLFENLRIP